jgi:hypothetical protein
MTDATRTRVSIIREDVYGELPTSPSMQQLRFNSSNLSNSINSVTSNEIDDTRNISDLSMVGIENSGDITAELSHLSHDELVAGVMFSEWVSTPERFNKFEDDEITDLTTSVITISAESDNDFAVGDVVRLFGFSNSANNVQTTVTNATPTSVTVAATLVATAVVNAGARIKKVGVQGASGDMSIAISPPRLISAASVDWTEQNIVPGTWVKIGGANTANQFATDAVNGYCRVIAVGVGTLTFDIVPTGFAADAGSGKTIRVYVGDYIRNDVIKHSYSIEQLYLDTSPVVRQMFHGVRIGTMEMSMESQSIIGITFGTMGSASSYLDSPPSGQTYWRETLTEVLNTAANVARIAENGQTLAGTNCIMSMTVNIDNGLRGKTCVGTVGYVDIGAGRCNVTGSLNTYFGSKYIAEKVINNEESGLDFVTVGTDGAAILVDLPRLKYSEGSTPITGIDTDVMLDASYQALKHPTLGYTIHMQRFSATS